MYPLSRRYHSSSISTAAALVLLSLHSAQAANCNTNMTICGDVNNQQCPGSSDSQELTVCCQIDMNGCYTACCVEAINPGLVASAIVAAMVLLCCICPFLCYMTHCCCLRCSYIADWRRRRLHRAAIEEQEREFNRRQHEIRQIAGLAGTEASPASTPPRSSSPHQENPPPSYYGSAAKAPDYNEALSHPIAMPQVTSPPATTPDPTSNTTTPPSTVVPVVNEDRRGTLWTRLTSPPAVAETRVDMHSVLNNLPDVADDTTSIAPPYEPPSISTLAPPLTSESAPAAPPSSDELPPYGQ